MVDSNPTYQSTAGSIINHLTGDIQYQVVNEQGAIMEVKVFLNQEKFKQYQKSRADNQKLVICIDRSGSMSGTPIRIVKEQCLKVG
jgi:propanediol utilization protein